jgi:hypothetical protein
VYTDLSWTPSPRYPSEAKPNLSQLYLSQLSLAKPAKLNFFKLPLLVYSTEPYSADASNLHRAMALFEDHWANI